MGEPDHLLRDLLVQVSPGSALREGLDRILHAHMGALIVLGDGPDVLEICSGGFHFDAGMTPQRLSELAKMDGAIILNGDSTRIAWANVHLVPDPLAPTTETGTRHRTAERVARCVEVPVIAVSEEMGTITLYRRGERRQLRAAESLIARANQLLQAVERFKQQLVAVTSSLDAAEIEDVVTVRDVASVVQRAEMVLRVADEITELNGELGEHGRLLRVQLDELVGGVADDRLLVIADYFDAADGSNAGEALGRLSELPTSELLAIESVIDACVGPGAPIETDDALSPRGLRLLRRVPHLSEELIARLVAYFDNLHRLLRAPVATLAEASGMGEDEAQVLKNRLARFAETSLLDRYR